MLNSDMKPVISKTRFTGLWRAHSTIRPERSWICFPNLQQKGQAGVADIGEHGSIHCKPAPALVDPFLQAVPNARRRNRI